MKKELLEDLVCPISKLPFLFKSITEFEKNYDSGIILEVKEGLLISSTGFIFPIIEGIPRFLIESFLDEAVFIEKHLPDYEERKNKLLNTYPSLIKYCVNKNKRSKKSFAFEWSFINHKQQDNLWNIDRSEIDKMTLQELDLTESDIANKKIIDVGCGHGIITTNFAINGAKSYGVELSKAVERAYKENKNSIAYFIQADLQFLPFKNNSFDILYSSGVIHHTNNTELSFSLIEKVLKPTGRCCLWLYHPQNNLFERIFTQVRKITSKLPLPIAFLFLILFVFPITFITKQIKRKHPPNWREEMIDLLDGFTPEFRHEFHPDLPTIWFEKRKYTNIKVTTTNQFGYSIIGNKKKLKPAK